MKTKATWQTTLAHTQSKTTQPKTTHNKPTFKVTVKQTRLILTQAPSKTTGTNQTNIPASIEANKQATTNNPQRPWERKPPN